MITQLTMKHIFIYSIIIVLLTNGFSLAQKGKISGKIQDLEHRSAVAFANVQLFQQGANTPFRGIVADENGNFTFERLPSGSYEVAFSEIGHQTLRLFNIMVSEQSPKTELGAVALRSSSNQLAEVQVTSSIGVTQISPGKTVYQISDLPVAAGASAGDILKLMPSVAMGGPPGIPRDVRYRGLSNAYTMVLVDGKNTGLQGNNREMIVNQIPASAIERIEIISNPGPQYDADGVNGVVNIILKKDRKFGTHGTAGLFYDNRNGYNASLGLSHKVQKADFYVNFDRNQVNYKEGNLLTETNLQTKLKNGVLDGYSDIFATEFRDLTSQNFKAGAKFYPTQRSVLSVEYLNGFQNEHRIKITDTKNLDKTQKFKDRTVRTEDRHENLSYNQWAAEFRQSFKNGSTLSISGNYVQTAQPKPRIQSDQKTSEAGIALDNKPAIQNVGENALDHNLFAQADYFLPISKTYAMRAGYKFSNRNRESSQLTEKYDYTKQVFVPSVSGTDNFEYDEDIHAIYISNDFTFNKLRAEIGFRNEYVQYTSASLIKATSSDGKYNMPLPTVNIYYNLDTTQYFKFSIGRRIRRPDMKQLNPFIDDSDPTKIKAGNPDLKPEKAWAYEVGYMKNFKRWSIGTNLFRRDLDNVIQKLTTDVSAGVVLEKQENFGAAYVQGVEFIAAFQLVKWWNINANYSRYNSKLKDERTGGGALQDQFDWSAKIISDFNFNRIGLLIQTAYNAVGPKISTQKTENTIAYWDMAISKRLLRNSYLNLRVADVFATNQKTTLETTTAQVSNKLQDTPGRLVSVGFTYNF